MMISAFHNRISKNRRKRQALRNMFLFNRELNLGFSCITIVQTEITGTFRFYACEIDGNSLKTSFLM